MNVTRAIIEDLLPVYAAGEASPDTQRLVEEYLAGDPDLAQAMEAARGAGLPPVETPPGLEARALDRTRRLLGEKHMLMGLALGLGYAPLAFEFYRGQVGFLMFRDLPWLAALFTAASLGCWVRFLLVCRRLQATGLQPRRGWRSRMLWSLAGYAAGIPLSVQICYLAGWHFVAGLPFLFSGIALIAGERLGQITEPRPIRPTTLFGRRDDD